MIRARSVTLLSLLIVLLPGGRFNLSRAVSNNRVYDISMPELAMESTQVLTTSFANT